MEQQTPSLNTSTPASVHDVPPVSGEIVGLQPASLTPVAYTAGVSTVHNVEPPKKQARTVSKQSNTRNKQDIDFSTGSTLLSWVPIVFVEVRLAFVLRTCALFCSVVKGALPNSIKKERFCTLLARVVVRNLVAKVDVWTKSKRHVSLSDKFDYLPLPNLFWYLINAFQPVTGVPGEKPDLYPDFTSLVISAQAWHRQIDAPSLEDDPSEIGEYLTCVDFITKRLGKDIFVNDVSSDSLLDSGYLEEDAPDDASGDESMGDEPLTFSDGILETGRFPKYLPVRCVSRRRLSRRDEIVCCMIQQRGFTPVSQHVKVYIPTLLPREDGALGVLIAYCVSDRKVENRHIFNELINPEVLPRRT